MPHSEQPIPAARQDGLLVQEVDRETVVYDVESKDAHALNPVAAAAFAGADGRRSLTELAAFASERVGEPVTEDLAWDALAQLEQCNLLEPPSGMSRRGLVRAGAALAASAPLITSLAMPAIAAAASCNVGKACNNDNDCTTLATTCSGCSRCLCLGHAQNPTSGFKSCSGGTCSGTITSPPNVCALA